MSVLERLPTHWHHALLFGPLSVTVGALLLDWSPWGGALVLASLPVLLNLARVGVTVTAASALGTAGAASVLTVAIATNGMRGPLSLAHIGIAAIAWFVLSWASLLLLEKRFSRWSATTMLAVLAVFGLLALSLLDDELLRWGDIPRAPELLANVPACPARCEETLSPAGHLRCSSVTRTERVTAVRECDDPFFGMVQVRAGGRETSVLLARDEPAGIWLGAEGNLLVESPVKRRGLSKDGAVLLAPGLDPPRGGTPAASLQVSGALLWLFGWVLLRVLFAIRAERKINGSVAGYVENSRFYPHDQNLASIAVEDAEARGQALLLGVAPRHNYRSGAAELGKVVFGTVQELRSSLREKRLRAHTLLLAAACSTLVGTLFDLARRYYTA